jgi:S1-C subfamily serine protease
LSAPTSGLGGTSASAGAAASTASDAVSRVDAGIVDINTTVGSAGAAAGTGMVVTGSGEVITNNHVIDGATAITATDVGNGRTYRARVVGYDRSHDVAVIQLIGANDLRTVTLGNSDTVRVGQSIITIGNAGGSGGTPSAVGGTVTALGRSISASNETSGSSEQLNGLIQLDGSLEPGDSGGPLVNSAGEVIGMDTAASSGFTFDSGAGTGFAIPINQVKAIAAQIEQGTSTSTIHIGATALIGVNIRANSADRASSTDGNAGKLQGAAVEGVVAGGPAASAGIQAGDTITALDGHTVNSATDLTAAKDRLHPGDRVTITWVDPSGGSHTTTITLTSGPAG